MTGESFEDTRVCATVCSYTRVCLFVITEAVKNNNLQQCGTSLCGLIGFEMPLLIFVHLQFRRLHQNKHDISAPAISLQL